MWNGLWCRQGLIVSAIASVEGWRTDRWDLSPEARLNHHCGTHLVLLILRSILFPLVGLGTKPKVELLHLRQQLLSKPKEALSDHFLAENLRCGLSFQLLHTLLQTAQVCAGGHGLMKPIRLSPLISCTWKFCPCKSQTETVTRPLWGLRKTALLQAKSRK